MAFMKKFISSAALALGLGFVANIYADDAVVNVETDSGTYDANIKAAANNFVDYIIAHRGGSINLKGDIVYRTPIKDNENYFVLDSQYNKYISHIALTSVQFTAHVIYLGLPTDVTATISAEADVDTSGGTCHVKPGTGKYTVVKNNNKLFTTILPSDLRSDGDSILNAFMQNPNLSSFCGN